MKDRISNELKVGDKVSVMLPEAQIFGYVAQIEDGGLITGVRAKGGVEERPGRILVSCVVAIPVNPVTHQAAELVRVYDVDKHDDEGGRSREYQDMQ